MSDRVVTKLTGKIQIKHGFPFKSEHFSETGEYVILTPGNFYEEGGFKRNAEKDKFYTASFPPEYLLKKGDLVVAMTEQAEGLLGSMAIVPEDEKFLHNQRLGLVTSRSPDVDLQFLYYLFQTRSIRLQVRRSATGSKVKHTSPDRLYDVVASLPQPETQRRIAKVLSTLDAKIDLNRRINAELEAMAKLLYDYWFVQFDFPISPAQAAAMGRPDLAGKPYRTSGGKMFYNEELKREIPEGWEVETLGEVFKTCLGGTPSRKEPSYWSPGEIGWMSSGENTNIFVTAPDEWISKKGLKNCAATLLPAGTVIMSIVRHIRTSILGIEAATNQSVIGILETDRIKNCFIYPFLEREIPRFMRLRTGAQQPHINKTTVDETPFAVPDQDTLGRYTSVASPVFLQLLTLEEQTQHLTQLRDWLLPMLMNGQVTVGESVDEEMNGITPL